MKKIVYCVLRHIAKFFAGYATGLFLLIAALTCGAMRCTDTNMIMQVTSSAALRIAMTETVLLLGLILASMHPFGCAISVAVISFIYHFWKSQFYLYPAHISIVMVIVRTVSSAIFTCVIATLLCKGLAKSGILKAYPAGQLYAVQESLEIDE